MTTDSFHTLSLDGFLQTGYIEVSLLKTFFDWCYRHDLIAFNPMGKFRPPKVSPGLPRPIPQKDHERLMQVIRKSKPRERLLFTLLAETGIRINEALSIYVEDIILGAGQEGIRFRGKGEYEREVPLRHRAATELVNSGVGIGTVRRLLGHRNLQTTQRYADLSDASVRYELDAFARKKKRSR